MFILYLTGVIFIATSVTLFWFMWKYDGAKNAVYTVPVTSWLQKMVAGKRIETVYLYMTVPRNDGAFSPSFIQMDWMQPTGRVALNAIVTNPR